MNRMRFVASCVVVLAATGSPALADPCVPNTPGANPITVENCLPGVPASEWDVNGVGDDGIQGFATEISFDKGETVHFKISSASTFGIKIYRLGYYAGNGARLVADLGAVFPGVVQTVPAADPETGLVDCGGWSESATWEVPPTAVSGIYIAKLTRAGGGSSHIAFIVRDDVSQADVLFKTSDATWQAYNVFGGNSLYVGSVSGYPSGHAPKVSYNRPFVTRGGGGGGGASEDWLFNAEYPMVRFLEGNGYDVAYTTDVDADRRGGLIVNHKAFLSVGHDEYWSAGERAAVEAARSAGVHLAFFSGNEIYWKTRWEPSVDGTATPYRTLVCYKEGTLGENACGGKCDPLSDVWTGLWRDGCAFPSADGCRPENALSAQISWDGTTGTLQVQDTFKSLRFWRNTAVATLGAGQTLNLSPDTLGYEWDWQQYEEHYPPGRVLLSTTLFNGKTHHLSLYRTSSGALVFGAGTVQWAWGLDGNHDRGSAAPSLAMQQATVNLLADMGVQPATLRTGVGLVAATPSGDTSPPASTIGFPASGASLTAGTPVTITGTASEALGVVAGVEVSVDGGVVWRAATGTASWSYAWTPDVEGSATIKSRAFDDLGNLEVPVGAPNVVTVTVTPGSETPPPAVTATNPGNNATGVATNAAVTATFAAALDPATVTTATFELRNPAGELVTASVAYDAPSKTAILTPGTLLAMSTAYSARLVGGTVGARIADPTGNALPSDYVWTFTTAAPDTAPPTVSSTLPVAGTGGVAPTAAVNAVFNEALSPSTVNPATFELRDPSNALVAAAVSYNVYTRTATLTPSVSLATGTYTARLAGGAAEPHVADLAGNALAADVTWSFTVSDFNCPCTVWSPTALPGTPAFPDGRPLELGFKFRASVDGYVTGVRFYKGAGNTGTHVGNLWSRAGTLLASATFTGETATGWQEVSFGTPVAIMAGTTYIASYHTNSGYYAEDTSYFTAGVDAPPLRALANGEDGPNGVYAYSSTSVFPTLEYNSSNYWADVVFATTVGPDVTAPVVVTRLPAPGAAGVAAGTTVTASFNEALDEATVSGSTFELRDGTGGLVSATVSYSASTRTATLVPASALAYSTAYTATLKGGTAVPHIADLAGNALANDVTWSFTISDPPPPPPTEGPGGPILVVSAAANPFGRYLVEILRTEGLNEFFAMDVSQVTASVLADYDVVVLGEMSLTSAQVAMLTDWTNAGGTLVAMRPDAQLADLLGLTPAGGTLADAYLLVNTAYGPGVGIVGQTIQFHGTADLYTLNGATALATLYAGATTPTTYPAATQRAVGPNGGKAIAFTYDLARSGVYTRQGNPAWKNQKRDGAIPPIRSDDMFYGNASFDPQPDWVNLDKVAIPQADEQQRLLANAIILGNLHRKPLPRLWYLPKGLKAAIVMTGDNHGDGGMKPRFDVYISQSPANCSVQDWECVRATGYEYVGSTFTDALAAYYHALGFETALHVDTGCASVPADQYEAMTIAQLANFHAVFPSIPLPQTNRTHCIAWTDWSAVAELEVRQGIRLDTNYYYWPYAWFQGRSGMFTGAGIPMRFAKEDGTIVDAYQATTQMTDDSLSTFTAFTTDLLNRAQGPEGYYGVFTCNLHFDDPNDPGSNEIVAVAQSRGIPVVSAKQMLDWLDGRNGSSFGDLVWSGHTLSFSIVTASGSRNMRAMLPTIATIGQLTGITRDGVPVATSNETIKGIEYAFFAADAGSYVATYLVDETAPLIGAVAATPHDDGTATITWTTNEPADSRVDYGTTDALGASVSDATLVTSHAVTLTGLSPSTTYLYRVRSADAASNATTTPAPPATLGFTTPAPVCFLDDTVAQFSAGTTDASTVVTAIGNGDVILRAVKSSDFETLPPTSEWQAFALNLGGTVAVSGGQLAVDGARYNTEPISTTYGPGASLEFAATFAPVQHQYIGFGGGDDAVGSTGMFYGPPWAMFGTGAAGSAVDARVFAVGGTMIDYAIPLSLLGTPHKYRIDWKSDPQGFDFYVDDALVHSETITLPAMRVAMSDLNTGVPSLLVDWVRVPPYAVSGSFLSRVYDAGTPTGWDAMSWTATLPAGTSVQMLVRQGDTATPDASWTSFASVASSGDLVGGTSRYIQYRADLATGVATATPVLASVHVSCATGPDTAPPVITNVTAASGVGGTAATVSWSTNELATSRVDYGTDPDALAASAADGTLVGSHVVTLTGLTPETTYYYRVSSIDGSSNAAVAPPLLSNPLAFTTSGAPCAADTTAADFSTGSPGSATYVAETADGEVTLAPAAGSEFSGSLLSAGWTYGLYGGSPPVVGGGHVSMDGAYVATTTFYASGRSVEFVATFDATTAGQHAGFGNDLNTAPWAIFSTHAGGLLEARTSNGTETNEVIPGIALGVPHRFRIDWTATEVVYRVDGAVVATHAVAIGDTMRPIVSDGPTGGFPFQADWIRMTPYPASGSYLSRVFDAGGAATWGIATWSSTLPTGTSLALFERHGNTSSPDGTWSAFAPIAAPGTSLGAAGRFVQYRADLATSDPAATPALLDVAIACTVTPDHTAPVIGGISASPSPDGVAAVIAWTTDEPADSRVDYGTSAGALTSTTSSAGFVTSHVVVLTGLAPATAYSYRVTSSDVSGNAATSPVPPATLGFLTLAAPCPADAAAADFAQGTLDANTVVSMEGDGEIILKPAVTMTEFSGDALPGGWASAPFVTGGTAAVAGGALTLDGARAYTASSFGPGRSLEFVATFTAAAYQNVGFAADGDFNNPWIVIGEGSATDGVYARAYTGAATLLSTSTLGTPHRYRIDWNTNTFVFYVDGVQVTTMTLTVASDMVAIAADYNVGGTSLGVDWLRVTPYAALGSYLSRVFDGGGPTAWGATTWTTSVPAGTTLSISARTGNTPTPDGTWSPYDPLTNGASVGANARYLQYKADLASAAPSYATPVLKDIAIACAYGPDVTPPAITNVAASPAPDGLSAGIVWATDERANSRVDYGTSSTSLTLSVSDAAGVRSHALTLIGLTPGTTYFYRVSSVDASGNAASEPNPPAAPLTFLSPMPVCFTDVTDADFGGGITSGTAVALAADGEIILAAALQEEFSGATLPTGWTSVPWIGGTATVFGGNVSVDGVRLSSPIAVGYTAGHVLEFVATFGAQAYQNAGLGAGDDSTTSTGMYATGAQPWAMFGTAGTTNTLYARINPGGDVAIPSSPTYIGSTHRYRIEWRADNTVTFLIDGVEVNNRATTFADGLTMRPGISDFTSGVPPLPVDWIRVTPYASSGAFESRIYDAGTPSVWGPMSWTADVPAGTGLGMSARTGGSLPPDGAWSAWTTIPTSGSAVGLVGRYVQYRAELTSNAALDQTPVLKDVSLRCGVPECTADVQCDDGNACTADTCTSGFCSHAVRADGSGCSDGDPCTVSDTCQGGVCTAGPPMSCDDGNACTHDACSGGACVHTASGACGVGGQVYYYRDNGDSGTEPSTKPVPGVAIDLNGGGEVDATTDASGGYAFGGLAGTVTIAPLGKSEGHSAAISSLDASAVARAAVGGGPPLTTNQVVAGDVTGNRTLSALDASYIARYAVGLVTQFPVAATSDWAFLRCTPSYPGDCVALPYTFSPIAQPETANFYAILYGEVTGNWTPPATVSALGSTSLDEAAAMGRDGVLAERLRRDGAPHEIERPAGLGPAELSLQGWTKPMRAGERRTLTIDLRNADGILGLDLTLGYDPGRVRIVSAQPSGIGSELAIAQADRKGARRIAAYGYASLSGSGSILSVTIEAIRNSGGQPPLTLGGIANEGQVPLSVVRADHLAKGVR